MNRREIYIKSIFGVILPGTLAQFLKELSWYVVPNILEN